MEVKTVRRTRRASAVKTSHPLEERNGTKNQGNETKNDINHENSKKNLTQDAKGNRHPSEKVTPHSRSLLKNVEKEGKNKEEH